MAATPKTQTANVEVTVQTRTLPHVEHADLPTALAAFQAEVPTIRKGNEAKVASQKGSFTYAYADLSDVTEKVMPLLGRHGLSFAVTPTQTKRGFVLKYALRHESGGALRGTYPLPPATTAPQQLGSAITYARRYVLCAVTGVAPGGDDDDAHVTAYAQQGADWKPADRPAPKGEAESRDREFRERADAASTRAEVEVIWQEAKQAMQRGLVSLPTLDAIAAIGKTRAAAEQPTADQPEPAGQEAPADPAEAADAEAVQP